LPIDLHVGQESEQRMDAHRHQRFYVELEQRRLLLRREPETAGISDGIGEVFAAFPLVMRQAMKCGRQFDQFRHDRGIMRIGLACGRRVKSERRVVVEPARFH